MRSGCCRSTGYGERKRDLFLREVGGTPRRGRPIPPLTNRRMTAGGNRDFVNHLSRFFGAVDTGTPTAGNSRHVREYVAEQRAEDTSGRTLAASLF
jgi:hypothetical protein